MDCTNCILFWLFIGLSLLLFFKELEAFGKRCDLLVREFTSSEAFNRKCLIYTAFNIMNLYQKRMETLTNEAQVGNYECIIWSMYQECIWNVLELRNIWQKGLIEIEIERVNWVVVLIVLSLFSRTWLNCKNFSRKTLLTFRFYPSKYVVVTEYSELKCYTLIR